MFWSFASAPQSIRDAILSCDVHVSCEKNKYSQGGRGTKIHVYLPYRGAI